MRKYTLMLCLMIRAISFAQIVQKGEVVLINSNNSPLPGVELVVANAVPTISDENGKFMLEMQKESEGHIIPFQSIAKAGYEIVNSKDIETWIASSERNYKIVMCKNGYLLESKMKFYKTGDLIYRDRYISAITQLEKLVESNQITEAQYIEKLKEAQDEYTQSKEQLAYYADRFSRINRDELKGVDSLAMACFDTGDVEGAIKTYENASLLEKLASYVKDQKLISGNMQNLLPSLIKQIKLYLLSEDCLLVEKASVMTQLLLLAYPNNSDLLELKNKLKQNQ